ncbi:EAL domain-containing protein [Gallaecimonas pentaromativorans]|uniref:EAL domain-containing protein n=1 Tax=Gallaecimonas pentaromativorans TaxID=584787 RepID=UPI003A900F82
MIRNDLFEFAREKTGDKDTSPQQDSAPWRILSVEDDPGFQASILYSLSNLHYLGRRVEVLTANSIPTAIDAINCHCDIALILLDVVMEVDDAGLRLVETIRNVIGNQSVRIVLLTGQPGVAPRNDVIDNYDINEYWDKSELKGWLPSIVTTNLRSWQTLIELEQARNGLQMIADASRAMINRQNTEQFALSILEQVSEIIGLSATADGIVALLYDDGVPQKVICASGAFNGMTVAELGDEATALAPLTDDIRSAIKNALKNQANTINEHCSVFYFKSQVNREFSPELNQHYLIVVKSPIKLSTSHIRLLQVFAENARIGFTQIALTNRLNELAYLDSSLKIHNRNWLLRELSLLNEEERRATSLIAISIDDHFSCSLTFGHDHIERIIQQLVLQLAAGDPIFRDIARIASDTLAVIVSQGAMPGEAQLKRLDSFEVTVDAVLHSLPLTVTSIGLSEVGELSGEDVLNLARVSLTKAHEKGLSYLPYCPQIARQQREHYEILQRSFSALENNEFFLVFQPKVKLGDGRPLGLEALIRWRTADGTMISPELFMRLAEASGTSHVIDIFVFEECIKAIKQLHQLGFYLQLSFNACLKDLVNPRYMERLTNVLTQNPLLAPFLELEITESQAMADYDEISPLLEELRKTGLKIALDDFGTGYSSLAHLAWMPIDIIKLDRSFVQDLLLSEVTHSLADMVIRLGEKFDYTIVAEGIETEEQSSMLLQLGCTLGQGYYYARPMPLPALLDWLATQAQAR